MHFFYQDSYGNQQGPVSAYDLPRYGVTAQTFVWKKGMSDWQPAGSIRELYEIFPVLLCSNCGKQIEDGCKFCEYCGLRTEGESSEQIYQGQHMPQPYASYQQPPQVRYQQPPVLIMSSPTVGKKSRFNVVGLMGLILASVAVFLGCIPVFGWVCLFSGLILSFVGLFQEQKGTAIVGFVISVVNFIFLFLILTGKINFNSLITDFLNF